MPRRRSQEPRWNDAFDPPSAAGTHVPGSRCVPSGERNDVESQSSDVQNRRQSWTKQRERLGLSVGKLYRTPCNFREDSGNWSWWTLTFGTRPWALTGESVGPAWTAPATLYAIAAALLTAGIGVHPALAHNWGSYTIWQAFHFWDRPSTQTFALTDGLM